MTVEIIKQGKVITLLDWEDLEHCNVYRIESVEDERFYEGWIGKYILTGQSDELSIVGLSLDSPYHIDHIQFTTNDKLKFSGPYKFKIQIFED